MENLANDSQTEVSSTETLPQLPSPTTSLICGIISIITASSIIPGFVLGIISLVSASNYKKAGGNTSDVKAGKTCGIIGLVLSIVSLIVVIAVMAWVFASPVYTKDGTLSSTDHATESMQEVVDPFLDSLMFKDPDMVEEGSWIIESSFNRIMMDQGIPLTFADCDLDSKKLAEEQLSEFGYSFLDAYKHQDEVSLVYSTLNRNPNYVGDEFERRLPEIVQSLDSGAIGKEEAAALIATAFEESFAETRTSKESLDVALQLQGGQWVLTGSEQGRIMNYVFSLTTEADKYGLSDSEYEKAKQFGLF